MLEDSVECWVCVYNSGFYKIILIDRPAAGLSSTIIPPTSNSPKYQIQSRDRLAYTDREAHIQENDVHPGRLLSEQSVFPGYWITQSITPTPDAPVADNLPLDWQ